MAELSGQEEGQSRPVPGPSPVACNAQLPAPSGSAGLVAHLAGSGGAGPPAGSHLPEPGKPEKSIKKGGSGYSIQIHSVSTGISGPS